MRHFPVEPPRTLGGGAENRFRPRPLLAESRERIACPHPFRRRLFASAAAVAYCASMVGAGTDKTKPRIGGGPAVILVRAQLAVNIGMCARAMANFGMSDLRLVNP